MTYLFRVWNRYAARFREAERIALLFDFDGTLSPIARRPDLPRLPPSTRDILQSLVNGGRVIVGVISGRALTDLRDRVGLRGIYYAGNHGLELRGPRLNFRHPAAAAARPALIRIARELRKGLAGHSGVLVEDKILSLSVHLRRVAPGTRGRVRRVVVRTLEPYVRGRAVRVTRGKLVLEVRPAVDWDKGSAVSLIRRAITGGKSSRTVFLCYLGDDETDEAAFRVLGRDDLAVFVGGRKGDSAASTYLYDSTDVGEFLKRVRGLTGKTAG